MNLKAIAVAATTTAAFGMSGVLAAAPAHAGTWYTADFGTYAQCDTAGEYKIEHHQAVQYSCDNVSDPWEPQLWRLYFLTP
ncbi:hypothetical protein BJY24_005547 [Nocardia transvalensis]|uniref:Chitin-binding type-3 domain-containing protein n=1 Tax=Nocardia transvalensis TaxID=37333 RepID=A0A7W9ULF2_9NOCA|nr:hypothetical protein [Nocardia transvalensis]MBB5916635.1 hypothetical protein [Nocardia transvalensis]